MDIITTLDAEFSDNTDRKHKKLCQHQCTQAQAESQDLVVDFCV